MTSLKATFKRANHLKQDFAQSSCLLTISLGQETHEEKRLVAALALINQSFKACTVFFRSAMLGIYA